MIDINDEEADDMLISIGASGPVELPVADLTKMFVYSRSYGVFYVSFGHHQVVMATLYAFHHDKTFYGDFLDKFYDTGAIADAFLELPGTCFRSGVHRNIFMVPVDCHQ